MGKFEKGNRGRPKGAVNKLTRAFREATVAVYNSIGGDKAYAEWATKNPTQFYQIASKMIPTEVSGPEGGPIRAEVNWHDTFAAPSTDVG